MANAIQIGRLFLGVSSKLRTYLLAAAVHIFGALYG